MKNKFQLILLVVFGFFIVGGLMAFATYKGKGGDQDLPPITMWGTFPKQNIDAMLRELSDKYEINLLVMYEEIPENRFDQNLLEAIASGRGPDTILFPIDFLHRYEDKVIPISYETFPARTFTDTYIEAAELFLDEGGVRALPISVDPLVMYWNRDIFNSASIPSVPVYWDEFLTIAPKLTSRDSFSNITKSTVALGEYRNVTNAKGILSALFLQAGNPVTQIFQGKLASYVESSGGPNAVNFYTEFANPVKPVYSWNRSLPSSKNAFLSGDLAVYFGYASELTDIRAKNPNLNFSVAPFPQIRSTSAKKTYGKLHGVAVLRQSSKAEAAFQVLQKMTGKEAIQSLSATTSLPPVRRDLLSAPAGSAALSVFYESALWTRSWIDPNPTETDRIFSSMIENITSGQTTVSEATSRASKEINQLIR